MVMMACAKGNVYASEQGRKEVCMHRSKDIVATERSCEQDQLGKEACKQQVRSRAITHASECCQSQALARSKHGMKAGGAAPPRHPSELDC